MCNTCFNWNYYTTKLILCRCTFLAILCLILQPLQNTLFLLVVNNGLNEFWRTNGSRIALFSLGGFGPWLILKWRPIQFNILSSNNQFFRHLSLYGCWCLSLWSILWFLQNYFVTKFESLTNFQYAVMNVQILMCLTIATLLKL